MFDIVLSGTVIISLAISSVLSIVLVSQLNSNYIKPRLKDIILVCLYFSSTYSIETLTELNLGIIFLSYTPFIALCRFKDIRIIKIAYLLKPIIVIIYYLLANIQISLSDVLFVFISTYVCAYGLWVLSHKDHLSIARQAVVAMYVGVFEVVKQLQWYDYGVEIILLYICANVATYFIVGWVVERLYKLTIVSSNEYYKDTRLDPLTDLYNFRSFDEDIAHNFHSDDYLLTAIDINNFKDVNDTFGHDKGNHILQLTSKLIAKHLDAEYAFMDYKVYRYDGDEIIVSVKIQEGDDLRDVSCYVGRLLEKANADLESKTSNFIGRPVGFSGGMTAFSLCQYNNKLTFNRSDLLLYEVKVNTDQIIKLDPELG